MMDCERIKEYVTLVNNKLQDKLLFRQGVRAAPASPCSSDEDAHPPVPVPVPLVGTQPSGRRRKNFVYPDPQRRLRSKTTPPKLPEELEMLAEDVEKADAASASEVPIHREEADLIDSEADEDAAGHMGLNE